MAKRTTGLMRLGTGNSAQFKTNPALARLFLSFGHWLRAALAREDRARSAFHLVPIGLIFGIAAFYGYGLRLAVVQALIILISAVAVAIWQLSRPWAHYACVLVAAMAAGQLLAFNEISRVQTTLLSGPTTVHVTGRVVQREADARGKMRYVVDVQHTRRPALSRPPERIRVVVSSRHEPIPIGGTFSSLVRLAPPSGPALPGGYDFAFGAYFNGIGAYGYSLGPPDKNAASTSALSGTAAWQEKLIALRTAISERVRQVIAGPEGAVAAALISGERAGIPEKVNDDLRVTGLSHVLSISGYHMALVAGFVMLLTRRGLALWPSLAMRYPTRKIAAAAALLVSTFYLAIAGPNVATERSYLMLVIMLGAILIDRPALTIRNVSIAALLVVAASPHEVVSASFQMSFAATAALIGIYAAISRWYTRRYTRETADSPWPMFNNPGNWIVLALLASFIASAATAPFAAYHFQRVAPFSLIANVLTAPLFSVWIMPLALIGTFLMPLGLDQPFLVALGWGLTLVFKIADWLATAFPDYPSGIIPTASIGFFIAAVLISSFMASALRWLAVPAIVCGLVFITLRPALPEVVVFEDGKQVALYDGKVLHHLQERPGSFIAEQWERAFGAEVMPAGAQNAAFQCASSVCQATTKTGLRVAWTDEWQLTESLCAKADIVIVARASKQELCATGAELITLRTLRRDGAVAIFPDRRGGFTAIKSASAASEEWNQHRLAPWPEQWKKP
ncbi:ComEC family competence protein [Aureimonas fodinaquatilis]|uniref:ComEC family competence protein n=1 Tax=Aureimonas fodinaquatilis TaxID=2565783 RepID=A0A5B0DX86_9HYPH|nr:ComEC/Rec2 family competence protein [Aureimonas fodinaquatilis]KAA0970485.1 ComEC family competence protein [Aureimonas fodinaquatilis]